MDGEYLHSIEFKLLEIRNKVKTVKEKKSKLGTSPVVQWLRLWASTAGGMGSIPGWGTKVPHAVQCGQKTKKLIFLYVLWIIRKF